MQTKMQKRVLFIFFTLGLAINQANGQQAAEIINIDKPASKDIYLAGRSVNILSTVAGDAVIAGQRINVAQRISEDVIAAGERISLSADVGDDLRAAGRIITVTASIGDDAMLAGETVTLGSGAAVLNRAWIAGRSIEIAGQIGAELRAAAQEIVISGEIGGDVHLIAENIEVAPSAKIEGNFTYRSASEANIAPGATITGDLVHQKMDLPKAPDFPVFPVLAFFFLTLLMSFAVMCWLFPGFIAETGAAIRQEGFKSIGIGLIFFLVIPPIILLLLISMVGVPLGLIALALYPIFIFIGFLSSVYFLSELILKLMGKATGPFSAWRFFASSIAITAIIAILLVPLLGGVGLIILILLGLGAVVTQLYGQYRV